MSSISAIDRDLRWHDDRLGRDAATSAVAESGLATVTCVCRPTAIWLLPAGILLQLAFHHGLLWGV